MCCFPGRRPMRYTLLLALGTLLTLSAGAPADSPEPPSFLNGRDLTGWEGLSEYWIVKGGALVGSTEPKGLKFNTFLCSKKKYRDFELSFKIRLKGGHGNSGVQIRSEIFDRK